MYNGVSGKRNDKDIENLGRTCIVEFFFLLGLFSL
jgi:hypothetical protein